MGLQITAKSLCLASILISPELNERMQEQTHILVVEDDLELANWVADYLQQNQFFVQILSRGDTVEEFVRQNPPDLILLDINLPGLDGFEICRSIRQFYKKPILMVTANDEEFDEVLGLEIGANDYITKPVTPRVLLARIKAQLRQQNSKASDSESRLQFGNLSIDLNAQSVHNGEELITLSSG